MLNKISHVIFVLFLAVLAAKGTVIPCRSPSQMEDHQNFEIPRDYPVIVRISAFTELKKLFETNENKYKHGFLSKAMGTCYCIRDSSRYYLLNRWVKPYFKKHETIKNWNDVTLEFLDKIIDVFRKLDAGEVERYRIIHNPWEKRMNKVHVYLKPILHKYLHHMDTNGYILDARAKLAV